MPSLLRDLVGLVLPVECAGCGLDDVAWCPRCAALLSGLPWRCENRAPRLDRLDGRGPLPVWTLADCTGDVRRAVVAWKDRGRADLTAPLSRAMTDQARRVASAFPRDVPVLVVPAPSTAASRRRRGGNLVDALAAAAAAGLRDGRVPAEVAPVLHRARGGDQVGLGARERARNLAGRVRVPDRRAGRVAGRVAVLVDDVLTTGATFAVARSALEQAGADVVAGLCLASTPGPDRAARLPGPAPGPPPGRARVIPGVGVVTDGSRG